ncbi:MAG TPA: hypothetical protein VF077_05880 [Nitrospiraceae bacterium]
MGQLVPFQQANVTVPSHIAKFLNDHSNIDPKFTVPQLSFRGKVWRIVLEGEETTVTKDEEPVSTVRVVVLDHNKARSRSYYEGAYEEGKAQMPACWSSDGVKPDDSVAEPQGKTCATCPQSVKGSKISANGKEMTACSQYKRVVVVPHNDLTFSPLLLRIPQTSMWDGKNDENEAKGWYAWDQYLDMLRARGAVHTSIVITKIKFDSRTAYPKLLFSAHDYLSAADLATVSKMLNTPPVTDLLVAPESNVAKRVDKSNGADDEPASKKAKAAAPPPEDDDDEPAPPKRKAKVAPPEDDDDEPAPAKKSKPAEDEFDDDEPTPPKKKAAPPPDEDDDDEPAPPKRKAKAAAEDEDDDAEPDPPKRKAKAAAPAAEAPAPKKKAAPPADDDDDEPAPKKKAAGKPANAGLGELMDEWDV